MGHISQSKSRPRVDPAQFISLLSKVIDLSMSENSYFIYFVQFSSCYGRRPSLDTVLCPKVQFYFLNNVFGSWQESGLNAQNWDYL